MTGLRNDEGDIGLARQHPVSVLITAPRDRAMTIANAIADEGVENLVVPEVQGLSTAQQTALLRLMETETWGRRRIIATTVVPSSSVTPTSCGTASVTLRATLGPQSKTSGFGQNDSARYFIAAWPCVSQWLHPLTPPPTLSA